MELHPHTPGIYRFPARMFERTGRQLPPCIPALGSALRSHPCVAVPSAQARRHYQNCATRVRRKSSCHPPFDCACTTARNSPVAISWPGVKNARSNSSTPNLATHPEWTCRKLQRTTKRRMPECYLVPEPGGRQEQDHTVAKRIQLRAASQQPGLPHA